MSGGNMPNFTGRVRTGDRMETGNVKVEHMGSIVKRLASYLKGKQAILVGVFLCAVVTTLITIVGTRLNGYVIDTSIAQRDSRGLAFFCLLMGGMYLVSALSGYGQNIFMIRIAQRVSAQIRRDLFASLQRLPLAYFDSHSSGDLMSRLTNDVDNINNAMAQGVVQLFSSIVTIVGMLAAMLLLSPLLTLICLVTIPLTFFTSRTIAKIAQKYFKVQQTKLGQLNGYAEEMISGQKAVKLFLREEDVQKAFARMNDEMTKVTFQAQCFSTVMGPCNNMINNLSYLAVAVAGGICVINGVSAVTVGVVFSFLLYMRNFTNPINNILNLVNLLQLALVSGQRVFDVMDEPEEQEREDAVDVEAIRGDIRMEHAEFSYVPGRRVLKDASLEAKPGETVAIVGPTGAGKTTIINLLTRFYEIDGGDIWIDGRPIGACTRNSLRASISMVLQDTYLFTDSVRENIRYGRIGASDREVEEAAKRAHAHDFIAQLPDGYDTVLADNGQNLSQGQRQLLGIARAILSQASVLILDEATSSVDTRTERLIQSAMLQLMRGKTCFVIAHRLSTIRNADQILVIDEGRVVERGNHEALMKAEGIYANLYNSQFQSGGLAL